MKALTSSDGPMRNWKTAQDKRIAELEAENAKLHGRINDAEQRIVAEQRWSTDRLRGVRADAILRAVHFFAPARDIDVEALKAYADKVRHGGAR